MFKRVISIILIIVTLLTSVVSLGGCSPKSNNSLTIGQWLGMINTAFGMESYAQEEPYLKNISKDNPYFNTIQIAAEWDVIDKGENIDPNDALCWEDALVTLVNVGNFTSQNASNEDKVNYAIKNFDNTIRKYWMNRTIDVSTATQLLVKAQEKWAKRTYTEHIEKIIYKNDVKDLTSNEQIANNYTLVNDTTVISENIPLDLNVGDVYILPSNEKSIGTKAYKVESITKENGNIYIENNTDIDLYDIAEDIFLQETIIPSADNTVIYDANGNVLTNNTANIVPQSKNTSETQIVNLLATNSNSAIQPLASSKMKHEFKVGEWKVSLSYKLDGSLDLDVAVGKEITKDKTSWEIGVGLSDVKVTNEIDYSGFSLKSASVRVDYETNLKFKATTESKVIDKVCAPYNNGNGKGLTNIKKAAFKDSKKAGGSGAQTVKLFSIDVWSVGVARVCLDVNFVVKVDGTFEITITNRDSKGIEYKNKNIRFINTSDRDVDVSAKAKIEATLGIGPALYTIGLKKPIIGVQAQFGAGATASIVVHLADTEGHLIEEATAEDYPPEVYQALVDADITTDLESIQRAAEAQGGTYSVETSDKLEWKLLTDVCINLDMYFIIRIGVTDSSFIAELLGGKIKLSKEFLGEKNGKFAYAHIEDFKWIEGFSNAVFGYDALSADQCTKKYKPFDNVEEKSEDESDKNTETDSIIKGEQIILSEMRTSIAVGQKYFIIVQEIPKGYSTNDLKIKIDDTKIAQIDDNGVIIGKEAGSTIVTVFTSDNKFSAYCALTVTEEANVTLDPLNVKV